MLTDCSTKQPMLELPSFPGIFNYPLTWLPIVLFYCYAFIKQVTLPFIQSCCLENAAGKEEVATLWSSEH